MLEKHGVAATVLLILLIVQAQVAASAESKTTALSAETVAADFANAAMGNRGHLTKVDMQVIRYRIEYERGWPLPRIWDTPGFDETAYTERFVDRFRENYAVVLQRTANAIERHNGVRWIDSTNTEDIADVRITVIERRKDGHYTYRNWHQKPIAVGRKTLMYFGYQPLCGAILERGPYHGPGSWNVRPCEARVEGGIRSTPDGLYEGAYCTIAASFEQPLVESQIAECLVRAMGFSGVSDNFVGSILGARLPVRTDYFLGGKSEETREAYAARMPKEIGVVDGLYLSLLGSERLQSGMTRIQVIENVTPVIEQKLLDDSLLLNLAGEFGR